MDISKISVSGIEYDVKDEYARNNMGVKEEDVVGIVDDYVAKNKEQLKGDKGDQGIQGVQGEKGDKGDKGDTGASGKDGVDGMDGAVGADGKSAYDVARDNGFEGTETEWLDSLVGKDGENGDTPQKGTDYWTNTDKEEILSECKSYIDSEILGGES